MNSLKTHEIFSTKIENDEEPYLDSALIIRELIKEGLQLYNEGDVYRFSLSEIMSRLNHADIELSRRNVGKVVHTLFKKIGFEYFSTSGDGHPKYEIKIEMKKIRELDEWFQEIYTWLGYRALFS